MPRPNTPPPLLDEVDAFSWKEWFKGLSKEQYYTSGLYRGSGVPNNSLGSNGDYYFRTGGWVENTKALERTRVKELGKMAP